MQIGHSPRGGSSGRGPTSSSVPRIELASSFIKFLLDTLALFLMNLPVFVLTFLVAIPNAPAGPTLLGGTTFLSAGRTQLLGRGGPIFLVVLVIISGLIIIRTFHRFAERHGSDLSSCRRCTVLFRCFHGRLS